MTAPLTPTDLLAKATAAADRFAAAGAERDTASTELDRLILELTTVGVPQSEIARATGLPRQDVHRRRQRWR